MKKLMNLFFVMFLFVGCLPIYSQTITGSGTQHYIPKFSGTTTINNSILFYSPATDGIGVSTTKPLTKLHVNGNFLVGSSIQKMAIGSSYGVALGWGNGYLGFNALRNSDNTWTVDGDGGSNGGAVIYSTVNGSINFVPIAKTGGATQTLTDTQIFDNVKLVLNGDGRVGIGTRSPSAPLHIFNSKEELPVLEAQLKISNNKETSFVVTNSKVGIGFSESEMEIQSASLLVKNTMSVRGSNNGIIDIDGRQGAIFFGNPDRDYLFFTCPIRFDGLKNGLNILDENNALKAKITEDGKIWAQEIIVQLTDPWPDYVFGNDYNLMPLYELESFIKNKSHLPSIPSANEIQDQGINLGQMDVKLVRKIEEMTLYIIELNKKIEKLERRIEAERNNFSNQ